MLGTLGEDHRRKHQNHHRVHSEIKDKMRAHIDSFLLIEPHYVHQSTRREYIDGHLSLLRMYKMYCEWCLEFPARKFWLYNHMFNFVFNHGFDKPKKDASSLCIEFNNMKNKSGKKQEYDAHINNKIKAWEAKRSCKETKPRQKWQCYHFLFTIRFAISSWRIFIAIL